MPDKIATLPIEWIRAERYCDATGDTLDAIYSRIRDGEWAAGKHYKRTGQRTLWVNIQEAQQWVENQPHVETVVKINSRKESKSGKEPGALACA